MFKSIETELNRIQKQYETSLDLVNRLHEIYAPYDYNGDKRDDIFYLNIRVEDAESVENRYINHITNLLKTLGFNPITMGYYRQLLGDNVTTTEDVLKNLTIKDFYDQHVYHYTLKKMFPDKFPYNNPICDVGANFVYTTNEAANGYDLAILLNGIWLLNHDDLMPHDVLNKVYNLASSGDTFIFNTCRVTAYKTGKVKINFSDGGMFKRFRSEFQSACERVKSALEKRDTEAA